MDKQERRFVQVGTLGTALEDPVEQQVLIDFFVNTILPSEVMSKKLSELSIVALWEVKVHRTRGQFRLLLFTEQD